MKKIVLLGVTCLSVLAMAACSADKKPETKASSAEKTTASTTKASEAANKDFKIADGKTTDAKAPAAGTAVMRQMYAAPHGDRSFAVVNVTMNGETIVAANIDEFQYVEKTAEWKGVPNADKEFGQSFPAKTVLVGKLENSDAYSANMKKEGKATQTWAQSMDAILAFVKGKKVSDLEPAVKTLTDQGEKGKVSDVVTGATFADTKGYLQAIIDTATSGMLAEGSATTSTTLKTGQVLAAPHGGKAFGVTTVAMDGDKVAVAFVDEFQYVDPATFGGVPNSNATFGEGIKDNQVLASKLANNEAYSANMKDHGGATLTWQANMQAIEGFVKGKTVAELEKAAADVAKIPEGGKVSDVVTGATFEDTHGYLQSIIDAAKAAK